MITWVCSAWTSYRVLLGSACPEPFVHAGISKEMDIRFGGPFPIIEKIGFKAN
jgi:hypothetical protein